MLESESVAEVMPLKRYKGYLLSPIVSPETIDKAMTIDLQQGDVLVASFPKTGTTWSNEMVKVLCGSGTNPAAHDPADYFSIITHVPIEFRVGDKDVADITSLRPHPWVVSTHLPANLLTTHVDNNVKIVISIRNPKDALVSYHHFHKMVPFFQASKTWDEFFERYRRQEIFGGEFFEWYESWLPYLGRDNVQLVFYEDMKRDMRSVLLEVATFLGVAPSDEQVGQMIDLLSFDNMKARMGGTLDQMLRTFHQGGAFGPTQSIGQSATSGSGEPRGSYLRKGQVGDWKNYFTDEQQEYIHQKYENSPLKNVVNLKWDM